MDESILLISPKGYLVYFALLSSIIVILAISVYTLLCSNRFRRPQFQETKKLSKTSSLLLIVPLAGVALYYVYIDIWGYFFTLENHPETIDISYHFPAKTISLNKADNISIRSTNHIRKGGTKFRLRIQLENGDEYMSQLINLQDLKSIISTVEKSLNVKKKI